MNRLQYRIVFNKERGQLMAVAENARSQGKSSGQSPARRSSATLSLLALAGGLGLAGAALAQIKADTSAPKNQQPTVLNTANGTPLVNIQTPGAAGVSRNSYSQFDVQGKGVVLNNVRGDAATQLGGWVQGNPWLAKGSARVILNEINSGQPSQLKGFVEIAGQRAELIIANPAGIQIDGGGFINASSATLSTGTTRWGADGGIAGFAVQGGLIRVDGKGLDASQTDYTALLARAVELNAGLWAKDLRVSTGTRVMASDGAAGGPSGGELLAPADATRPRYALDSTALGGIYAQRITLVGTEAGLGVRQAGQMVGGQLRLSAEGWLDNSGTIYAQDQKKAEGGAAPALQLRMREGVRNAGWLAARGSAEISGERLQGEAGSVTAAGLTENGALAGAGDLSLQAVQSQRQAGQLLAAGRLEARAPSLDLSTAQAQAAQLALSGATLRADGALLSASGALSVGAEGLLSTQGSTLIGGRLQLKAGEADNRRGEWLSLGTEAPELQVAGRLNLENGRIAGNGRELAIMAGSMDGRQARLEQYGSGALRLSADAIDLREAGLASQGGLEVRAAGSLLLDGAQAQAQSLQLRTDGLLSQREAQLRSAGKAVLSADRFDNRGGRVLADGGLQLQAGSQLLNDGGQLQAAAGGIELRGAAALSNKAGLIAAREGVDLEAGSLEQAQGGAIAGRDVRLQLQGTLRQQGEASSIAAEGALRIEARAIDNQGQLRAGTTLNLSAQDGAELGGTTYAGGALSAHSGGDLRVRGLLAAQGDLQARAERVLRADAGATIAAGLGSDGRIGGAGRLVLEAGGELALQGQQLAAEAALSGARIDLSATQLQSSGRLSLQSAGELVTEGAKLTAGSLDLAAQDWRHAGGRLELSGRDDLAVALSGRLDNREGSIQSNGRTVSIGAQALDNRGGLIGASGEALHLQAQTLDNRGGRVLASGELGLRAGQLENHDGQLGGRSVQLRAEALRNTGQGLVAAEQALRLDTGSLLNAGSLQAKGALEIDNRGLLDNAGLIRALGDARLHSADLVQRGTTAAAGDLAVRADRVDASGSFVAGLKADNTLGGAGELTLKVAQTLRHGGSVLAAGRATLEGAELQLQGAQLQAAQLRLEAKTGELRLDRAALAAAGDLELRSASTLNTEAARLSGGRVTIGAANWAHAGGQLGQTDAHGSLKAELSGRLDNRGGQIAANGQALNLAAQQLDNGQGRIVSAGQGSELKIVAGSLSGAQGALLAQGALRLNIAGDADLKQAQTQAQQISLQAGSLQHQGGQLLAQGGARLEIAGTLDNTRGLLQSAGDLHLRAGLLNNEDGQIDAATLNVAGGRLDNLGQGLVAARGRLALELAELDNAGRLQAGGDAELLIGGELRNSGLLHAQGRALVRAAELKHSGTLAAAGDLELRATNIASSGSFAAGLKADNGLAAQGDLRLVATQRLQHSGSSLAAGTWSAEAASLDLQGSKNQARQIALQAQSGDLQLNRTTLAAVGQLSLSAAGTLDSSAATLSGASVALSAQDWRHAGGELAQTDAAGHLQVAVTRLIDNQGGRIGANAGSLTLKAQQLDNRQGRIVHAGEGALTLELQRLDGTAGQILGRGDLNLQIGGALELNQAQTQGRSVTLAAASLAHRDAKLISQGAASLNIAGALDNSRGLLQAGETLRIDAASLGNLDGQVEARALQLRLQDGLDNAGRGLIAARETLTVTAGRLDNAGNLQAQGAADLTVRGAIVNSGSLYAQGPLTVRGGGTLNHTGLMAAQGALSVEAARIASSGNFAAGLRPDNQLAAQGDLSLHATETLQHSGSLLAAGRLSASAAGLQLQDSRVQAQRVELNSQGGELRLDRASLGSAGLLKLDGGALDTSGATLSAAQVEIEAQRWTHAGGRLTQTDAAGSLDAKVAGRLDNVGGQIAAAGRALNLQAGELDNGQGRIVHAGSEQLHIVTTGALTGRQGQILGSGELRLEVGGAADLSQAQTQGKQVLLTADSLRHQGGQLLATADARLQLRAGLDNQAGLLQAGGELRVQAGSLDNQDGQLGARAIELNLGQLNNNGRGLINAQQGLTLNASGLANAGSLQADGDIRLNLGGDLSNGGSIYAQGSTQLQLGGHLLNSGTLAAQGALTVEAGSIAGNGTLAAGLRADNTLAAQGDLTLRAVRSVQQGGKVLAAGALNIGAAALNLQDSRVQAARATLSATGGALQLERAVLASAGELNLGSAGLLATDGATLSGASVVLNAAQWRHVNGALTQTGAAGSLQAKVAGQILNQGGQIQAEGGLLRLEAQQLDNGTGRIAQASGGGSLALKLQGGLDGAGGQILSGGGLTIEAGGALNLANAKTQGKDVNLSGASLNHQGGSLVATGSARLTVDGLLDNRGGSLGSSGLLEVRSGSLVNGGDGLLQGGAGLRVTVGATLDNQGGRLRSGAGELQLNAGRIDNRGGSVGSDGALTVQTGGELLNAGGSLVAQQGLTLDAAALGNQQGRIASLRGGAILRVAGGLDNQQGSIQAAQALELVATGLNNRQGEIDAGRLSVDTRGQTLDNSGGRVLARQQLSIGSGTLENRGGLIQSLGDLSLTQTAGAALHNGRDAGIATPTGVHAQGALTIANSGSLVNEAGISAGAGAQIQAGELSNRAELSAAALNLNIAGTLDNQGGRLVGTQSLNASARQLLNQGGMVYGGNTLTLRVQDRIDNSNTVGAGQGIQGGQLDLGAAQLDNRGGQVRANGDLLLNIGQTLDNAGGLIGAGGRLTIGDGGGQPTVSTLSLNNGGGGRIWSGDALSLSVREFVGGATGQISSGGSLSLQGLVGDFVYGAGNQLEARGDLTLGLRGNFTNQGTLRSGGALTVNAVNIDNRAGAELSGRLTFLNAAGGTLSNRGLIDGDGVSLTADRLLNLGSGRIYGGDIVIDGGQLLNDREGGQAAVIAARRSLDARLSRDIVNRDGALIFADGDLGLSGSASLLNENATIEASRLLTLELGGSLINRSVHAGAGSGQESGAASGMRVLDSKAFIRSGGNMEITAGNVLNSGATIEARGDLALKAGDVQNVNPYLMWKAGGDPLGDKVRFVGSYDYCDPTTESGPCLRRENIDEWVYLNGRTLRNAWGDYVLARMASGYDSAIEIHIQGAPIVKRNVPGYGDVFFFEPYETPESGGIYLHAGDALRERHPGQAWEEYVASNPRFSGVAPELVKGGVTEVSQSSAGRIVVGGQLQIQGARITNDMSIVEGRDGVAITGGSVNNLNRTVTVVDPTTGVGRQVSLTLPPTARTYIPTAGSPGGREQAGAVNLGGGASAQSAQNAGLVSAGGGGGLSGLIGQEVRSIATGGAVAPGAMANAGWRHAAGGAAQAVDASGALGGGLAAAHAQLRADGPTAAQQVDAAQAQNGQGPAVQADQRGGRSGVLAALRAAARAQVDGGAGDAEANKLRAAAQAAVVESGAAGAGSKRQPGAASGVTLRGANASFNGKPLAHSVAVDLNMPSNSLFKARSESSARYLVETDPQFANYRSWLSSDHLLQQMQADPAMTQKRLGDGFYEQRLVREQIGQLTGTAFLPGYSSDEAMYRALLDNGASFAKQHQLRPGVALSAEQMSQLTTDLVWLVEQEVSLADGSRQRVLVPQVYLLPREGDLQPSGALIAGGRVEMALSGDFTNQGQVRGTSGVVDVKAQNIANTGSLRGASLALSAREDLRNVGGALSATGDLLVSAGRDLVMETTTASGGTQRGNVTTRDTVLDRVASLSAGGVLVVQAGRDVSLQAVQITQQGSGANGGGAAAAGGVLIQAGRDLTLGTVETASAREQVWNANNFKKESRTQDVGTTVQAEGALVMKAGQDLTATAATLKSVEEGVTLAAGRDVALLAGEANEVIEQMTQTKKRGFLKKKTTTTYSKTDETVALGTEVSGRTLEIKAGEDLRLSAAQVVSDLGTTLTAGGDITVDGVNNRLDSEQFSKTVKSGLFSGGGLGFTIGKQSLSQTVKTSQTQYQGSVVGAVQGDVNVVAGGAYRQTGSHVQAPAGDVNIQAKSIDIVEARELGSQSSETRFKQSGLTVAITSPVLSAIQAAGSQIKAAQNTGSDRMKALAAANVALNAKQALDAVQGGQGLVPTGAKNPDGSSVMMEGNAADKAGGIGINFSVGGSSSQSKQQSSADSARGSSVTAGGNVSIKATGAGEGSDLTVRGSEISAAGKTLLKADDQINILAAQNSTQESSSQSSKSGSIGVGINLGAGGLKAGVTVSASVGKGQGAGNGTSYSNSHISGSQITLDSGGDTTIKGGVVKGDQVTANVGGNLNIESLQDKNQYREKSQQVGGSVTFGPSPGGSLNAGKTKIDSDYLSVGEQSAIRAGDGGFDVKVQGRTDLKGGQITSTQAAIDKDKNNYEAKQGTTTTDLQNSASYEAKSVSVGLAAGAPKPGASLSAGLSGVGLGSDSGDASSTSMAGISGVAGDLGARTGDKEAGLKPIFDKERVKQEVAAQVAITSEFGKQASKAVGNYAKQQYDKAKEAGDKEGMAAWEEGGKNRVALHTLVGGLTGNIQGAAGAGLSQVVVPELGKAIQQLDVPLEVKQALVAVAGAATGAAVGGSAGASTATNATLNNFLSQPQLLERNKALAVLREDESKNFLQKLFNPVTGTIDAANTAVALQYLDRRSDALLQVYRSNPEALTVREKNELAVYLGNYAQSEGAAAAQNLLKYGPPQAADSGDVPKLMLNAKSLKSVSAVHESQAAIGGPALQVLTGSVGALVRMVEAAQSSAQIGAGLAAISDGDAGRGVMNLGLGLLGLGGSGAAQIAVGGGKGSVVSKLAPVEDAAVGRGVSKPDAKSAVDNGANGGQTASKPLVTHQPLDDLLAQANKPINDTGLSQATRAWDKHDTSRPGGTFEPLAGNTAGKNEYVKNWIRDLLTNSQTVRTNLPGGAVEYRLQNGQGVRFESSGKVNFVDPRRP
ncbi:filamentous hemagglutinin N-terminal domain-containing protein [Roseateles sp. DAIF2]|uniref:hemagglutinin repeat-containing protein n=1 Tax=Roseateles sp. DAIF2 TaxID=2714952 RepID=UPI0018A273CB|nr:hemagglutinin repeat-containing protein [Roseateles sp. DAIF2]QPF73473.1 filamentous hemagglutinin N-terminal domain-containing protein [Roseateles sp. DAIF2]